jgi:hypothetical protein
MKQGIKIGDWVNSYSKGIYRIEKIIEQFYDESSPDLDGHKIGDKEIERVIVSKRLLNSKLKKSISYESCSEYFISHLDSKQNSELEKILADNSKLLTELDEYEIPTLTTIYNSDLQIDNDADLQTMLQLINFIKNGKTFLEIENEMKRLDILRLKPKNFGNYSFQLFNFNEEYIDKRKIWRDAKLTKP